MIALVLVLIGIALLIAGGAALVRGASEIATGFGVSPMVIGLTIVGFGTSSPELVVNVVGAMRDAVGLAFGNVVGSNIFNSLVVLPAAGVITEIPVPRGGIMDRLISWLFAAALIPLFFFGKALLGRISGAIFLLAYAGYAALRLATA